MNLAVRSTSLQPWLDVFVYSFPGGGKTGLILSSYWEKEGKRGGPVVFDFDKRGVDATAADMGLSGKIPVVELKTTEDIIYSCTYWEDIIKGVNESEEFKDYQVDLFAWDTVSSMEDLVMGEPKRGTTPTLPASKGSGFMALDRKREVGGGPAVGDYKVLINFTKAFLRRVREMPMHTIVTCHAGKSETADSKRGISVAVEDKTFGVFPDLIGQNKYSAAKLHDFFLFMEQKGGKFTTYTQPRGNISARTRLRKHLPALMDNVSFWDLKSAYDSARGVS